MSKRNLEDNSPNKNLFNVRTLTGRAKKGQSMKNSLDFTPLDYVYLIIQESLYNQNLELKSMINNLREENFLLSKKYLYLEVLIILFI